MDFEPLNKLLDKKMDRKEFLIHIGAAVVAVSGVTAIIKSITDPHGKNKKKPASLKSSGGGYGKSPYGL